MCDGILELEEREEGDPHEKIDLRIVQRLLIQGFKSSEKRTEGKAIKKEREKSEVNVRT